MTTQQQRLRDGRGVLCLSVALDDGVALYYSSGHIPNAPEPWRLRIVSADIPGALDARGQQIDLMPATIVFDNAGEDADGPGHFPPLLRAYRWRGREATLELRLLDSDGNHTDTIPLYKGSMSPGKRTKDRTFSLSLRNALLDKITPIQISATPDRFPDVPEADNAVALPIVMGVKAAANGAVWLPRIHKTNLEYAIQGACKSVDSVKRLRGGAFSNAAFSVGYAKDNLDHWNTIVTISSDHVAGDEYYANISGLNTSTTNGGGSLITNVVTAVKTLLVRDTGVGSGDFDSALWSAAEADAVSRGLLAANVFGAVIGGRSARPGRDDRVWNDVAKILGDAGFVLFITPANQVGIKRIDVTSVESGSLRELASRNGDFSSMLEVDKAPYRELNIARVAFNAAHSSTSGWANSSTIRNNTFIEDSGNIEEDQQNYSLNDVEKIRNVMQHRMSLRTGDVMAVSWNSPGLRNIDLALGDPLALSDSTAEEGWDLRQVIITKRTVKYSSGLFSIDFEALTNGHPVALSAEAQAGTLLTANKSTFLGLTDDFCGGNPFDADSHQGVSNGAKSYLRHGHHFVQDQAFNQYTGYDPTPGFEGLGEWIKPQIANGVPACLVHGIGYSHVDNRALLRWRMESAAWSEHTLDEVIIKLFVLSLPSLFYAFETKQAWLMPELLKRVGFTSEFNQIYRAGWTGATLHLCSLSNFTESTTWDGCGWDDSTYIGAQVGAFPADTGIISAQLNTTGVQAFQDAVDGVGQGADGREVNMVLQGMARSDYTLMAVIASTRYGDSTKVPRADIVSTVIAS